MIVPVFRVLKEETYTETSLDGDTEGIRGHWWDSIPNREMESASEVTPTNEKVDTASKICGFLIHFWGPFYIWTRHASVSIHTTV